jgi:hypothetical protein
VLHYSPFTLLHYVLLLPTKNNNTRKHTTYKQKLSFQYAIIDTIVFDIISRETSCTKPRENLVDQTLLSPVDSCQRWKSPRKLCLDKCFPKLVDRRRQSRKFWIWPKCRQLSAAIFNGESVVRRPLATISGIEAPSDRETFQMGKERQIPKLPF